MPAAVDQNLNDCELSNVLCKNLNASVFDKMDRQSLLEYFHRKTTEFQSLTQHRAEIIKRSRKNLKKIHRQISKNKATDDNKSLVSPYQPQKIHPFPACAPLDLKRSFGQSKTELSSSKNDFLSVIRHHSDSLLSETSSLLSTTGESESSIFTKITSELENFERHRNCNKICSQILAASSIDLDYPRYWANRNRWNIISYETELELFKNKIRIILRLAEELLDYLYQMDN